MTTQPERREVPREKESEKGIPPHTHSHSHMDSSLSFRPHHINSAALFSTMVQQNILEPRHPVSSSLQDVSGWLVWLRRGVESSPGTAVLERILLVGADIAWKW